MMINGEDKIRVLLVDDHPVVRAGYRMLLNNTHDIIVVDEAGSARETYKKYHETPCDIIIMDLSMPDISGIDAIRNLVSRDSNVKVLAFSMHEEVIFVEQALKAGARGYVTKSCAPDIMIDAIRKVSKGQIYITSEIAQHLVVKNIRKENSELSNLSPREFAIFCLIAEGLDINEIGERMALSSRTVANYCSQIKTKLNCKTAADIARLAVSNRIITP